MKIEIIERSLKRNRNVPIQPVYRGQLQPDDVKYLSVSLSHTN